MLATSKTALLPKLQWQAWISRLLQNQCGNQCVCISAIQVVIMFLFHILIFIQNHGYYRYLIRASILWCFANAISNSVTLTDALNIYIWQRQCKWVKHLFQRYIYIINIIIMFIFIYHKHINNDMNISPGIYNNYFSNIKIIFPKLYVKSPNTSAVTVTCNYCNYAKLVEVLLFFIWQE